jgi:hypothetical protein
MATVFVRLLCSLFAWRFGEEIPPNLALAAHNQLSFESLNPSAGWRYLLYGIWERFDTLWYLHIATHGYDRPAATVFYPLYPFLIHCLSRLAIEPIVAALCIATGATFFLFWGVQELVCLDWPGKELPALVLFAAWPASFIFMAAYPDSLLIALAVWSIYWARKDRWWLAGAFACAAGMSKAAGVLVTIPLLYLAVRSRAWNKIPAVAIAPVGFAAYTLWLKISGFPSSDEVYAKYWVTKVDLPWNTLWAAIVPVFRDGDWLIAVNLFAVAFCGAVLLLARPIRMEYVLFSGACLIVFLTKHSTPVLQSTPRYILLVFPVFFCCANWIRNRSILLLILLVCCPLYFAMLRTFLWWGLIV